MNTHGITDYSDRIPGQSRNHDWPVRFDVTDGCLGISQYEGDDLKDRVLLSPEQVRALIEFYRRRHPRRVR